ncbi:hypothetical protein [Altericroceibacterium xinjiangense]|uniref:hypothetical protein n=1 Tax=Altericroceibacterium xinjiangense TaxID=762261 RepID=UPI000F7F6D25|nr:hypothetical protein [Altericroceibacterium xinjiangense]
MKTILIAAMASAGLLAGCATDAGMVDRNLISGTNAGLFDTDRDGLFERAEYDAFRTNNFGTWDANRDNRIDRNEFTTGWRNVGWDDDASAFGAFDDDADGFLGMNEFFGDDEFGVWDESRDGVLDGDEWF